MEMWQVCKRALSCLSTKLPQSSKKPRCWRARRGSDQHAAPCVSLLLVMRDRIPNFCRSSYNIWVCCLFISECFNSLKKAFCLFTSAYNNGFLSKLETKTAFTSVPVLQLQRLFFEIQYNRFEQKGPKPQSPGWNLHVWPPARLQPPLLVLGLSCHKMLIVSYWCVCIWWPIKEILNRNMKIQSLPTQSHADEKSAEVSFSIPEALT